MTDAPLIRKRRIRDEPEQELVDHDQKLQSVVGGVSTHWLKNAFRQDYDSVRGKLRMLQPLRIGPGGAKLYDIAAAAAYLVDPKIDIAEYLESLRPSDLPQKLQAAWWEAKLKRQKFEKNAGDLWPSERVLEKLAVVFKRFKETSQLWLDDLENQGATSRMRELMQVRVDALLADMYRELVADAKTTETPSQLADIDEGEEE